MALTQNQFSQLMQSVTLALSQRDLAEASVLKDRVLRQGTSEMKGQCLLYVGMIQESCGDLHSAQQEWGQDLPKICASRNLSLPNQGRTVDA